MVYWITSVLSKLNFKPTNIPTTNGPLWRGVNASIMKPVLIFRGVCAPDLRGKKLSITNIVTHPSY